MKWILGILLWAGLAAFFVILIGAAKLGGKNDPRRLRLIERNRRTVRSEKRQRKLVAAYNAGADAVNEGLEMASQILTAQGLPQDPLGMDPPAPTVVCLDCLWKGYQIPEGWKCEDCGSAVRLWSEV